MHPSSSSLLTPLAHQSIQSLPPLLYYSLALLDRFGRAHFAKKMACRPYGRSGARYSALPHCSRPLPTTSGHLGSPPHASRCSSTSATRQLVGPLLFPSPLPLLTHAPWPPECTSEHAHTRDAPD